MHTGKFYTWKFTSLMQVSRKSGILNIFKYPFLLVYSVFESGRTIFMQIMWKYSVQNFVHSFFWYIIFLCNVDVSMFHPLHAHDGMAVSDPSHKCWSISDRDGWCATEMKYQLLWPSHLLTRLQCCWAKKGFLLSQDFY